MNSNSSQFFSTQSHVFRAAMLAILVLFLQIPISSIRTMVDERQQAKSSAVVDVQNKWGMQQHIVGPILLLPFQNELESLGHKDIGITNSFIQFAVFFPDTLDAKAQIQSESRYRGNFEVPLYQTEVSLAGSFNKPDLAALGIDEKSVLWDKAKLLLLVSDARAIQEQASLSWNEESLLFSPGSDTITNNMPGYHVNLANFTLDKLPYKFSIALKLNGSGELFLSPLGKDSTIKLQSDWPHPSFQGNLLPTTRKISDQGFIAEWRIPYLGRNFPQQTQDFQEIKDSVMQSSVGASLLEPINNYRMVDRSIKYEILFFVLTFLVIWLFDVLNNLRVHIMQYLFIGMALCVFYLLELSLSEHIGFYLAYVIATSAIVSMICLYSLVVLKTKKRAAIIGSGLLALYIYLLSLLQEQNYALVIGSVGLMILLSIIMYSTRNVDWYELAQKSGRFLGERELGQSREGI